MQAGKTLWDFYGACRALLLPTPRTTSHGCIRLLLFLLLLVVIIAHLYLELLIGICFLSTSEEKKRAFKLQTRFSLNKSAFFYFETRFWVKWSSNHFYFGFIGLLTLGVFLYSLIAACHYNVVLSK